MKLNMALQPFISNALCFLSYEALKENNWQKELEKHVLHNRMYIQDVLYHKGL